MKISSLFVSISLIVISLGHSQSTHAQIQSRNGWGITPRGDLKVLIIFAEINYPTVSKNVGNNKWQQGQLPTNADSIFDYQWTGNPMMIMTKFFSDMSFGEYRVLGDYINQVITVDSADVLDITNHGNMCDAIISEANDLLILNTNNSSSFNDFDLWSQAGTGQNRSNSPNDRYDHVMLVTRNWKEQTASTVSNGSIPSLYSKNSDTWSLFNTSSFDIRKHEYGHLLFGPNNFHSCGGHDRGGINGEASYFIATQGGWGIMGNAGSSLKTINAFERRRLDWKGTGKSLNISCGHSSSEDSTDLNALDQGHEGTYVLSDFILTGDAIRIKLPFIPGTEFQQWLWIENHQGYTTFDNHNNVGCQTPFNPGLYMYIQVDKESMTGSNTYDEFADFIKPLPASGLFDVSLGGTIYEYCFGSANNPHLLHDYQAANPLTGYSDLQQTDIDMNGDGHIDFIERTANYSEVTNNNTVTKWQWRGHSRHSYHNGTGGNKKIGIATNPSTASHMTLVSGDQVVTEGSPPHILDENNRTIYLNGISVEITNYNSGTGEITVDVQFDDVELDRNTRWCGDDIVLPNMAAVYPSLASTGWSLTLNANKILDIDRNHMPSRIDDPDTIVPQSGPWDILFNDPTTFRMASGAKMKAYEGSVINVMNGSSFVMGTGNELDIENGTLNILNGSSLILNKGSLLDLSSNGGTVYIDSSSTLIIRGGADMHLNGYLSELIIEGTVIVEDSGNFSFTGLGFITFNGNIQNDTTASWELRGEDMDDILMVLYQTPEWIGGNVNFTSGTIQYVGDNLEINIADCDHVDVTNIRFTSKVFGYAFEDNKALHLLGSHIECQSSEFLHFYNGILTNNRSDTALIENCHFESTVFPVDVSHYGGLKLINSDLESVGNLPSGSILYYNTGLKVDNTPYVQMDQTNIVNCAYGIDLDSVDGFYMRSGTIDSCDYGLRSSESLVFLRNGATIKHSLEFGIHTLGRDPLNNMITLGDSGCANVIQNDVAISGLGTVLNMDAYIHAENSGVPSFVQFNRLDQNAYNYIEMCYHDSTGIYVPDTVHMKGIYFGGSAPSGSEFETYMTPYFYPQTWSCGTSGISDITDDFSQHSTCTAQGICDCYIGVPPPGNGSFGGVSNKMASDQIDTLNYAVKFNHMESEIANINKLVLASFQGANRDFLQKDSENTRKLFTPLASVGLLRINERWLAVSNRGRLFKLDTESLHRIVVAKVLTDSPLGSVPANPDIFKEFIDWESSLGDDPVVSIYPNPSYNYLNIDVSGNGQQFQYSIVSNLGITTKNGVIGSGMNNIDLSGMNSGVYLLLVHMEHKTVTHKIVKSFER